MLHCIFFIFIGYFSGSVLYAKVFGYLLKRQDIIENTKDQNPGAANAFMQGGFVCGVLTLICDILKGLIPVFIFRLTCQDQFVSEWWKALVVAAPVVGHMFPFYFQWKGGKGIAVSFGCLLGLLPDIKGAVILAFFFILFSVVIRVEPHIYRTMITYLCSAAAILFTGEQKAVKMAFTMIAVLIVGKLAVSKEEKKKFKVRLLWMH